MTIRLLCIGDGPRDKAVVPILVSRILNTEIAAEFSAWKDIRLQRGGRGLGSLGRQVLYALRQARDRRLGGVVAAVDSDKDKTRHKLADLVAARKRDRAAGNTTPAAFGEAIPHLEAWLLDDAHAVRTALGCPPARIIPSPTRVNSPKDELNYLCTESDGNRPIQHLVEIASRLKVDQCIHREETGFRRFVDEVRSEFGPACAE